MLFTVNRDVFSDAVSFTVKLLPQRPTQPLLTGIMLHAQEGELTLSVFDYEVSARTKIAAEVITPGQVLVSGRLLGEIAQRLPHAAVQIGISDTGVEVRCGSANFVLHAMPVEEYPQLPMINTVSGVVPAKQFSDAVNQVCLAASRDDVTPVITGVYFVITEHLLTLTATDRYRVATRGIDWEERTSATPELNALVPAKIVTEVGKTFAHAETLEISIIKDGERELIAFSDGNKTVTSLLIRGNYPPVNRLFPDAVDNFAIVNTSDLVEAVGRVGLVLDRDAALRFSFTEGQVTLEAAGTEAAQAEEIVEAHLASTEVVVSLKPQFLLDGLKSTQSEFARIAFTKTDNPAKPGPVMITSQQSKDSSDEKTYRYLLQPNLLLR